MIRVQAPNGDIVEFPDGTSDDVMSGAMRKTYGGPEPAPKVGGMDVNSFYASTGADKPAPAPSPSFADYAGQAGRGLIDAATGVAGLPRFAGDFAGYVAQAAGVSPQTVAKAKEAAKLSTLLQPFVAGPTTGEMNTAVNQALGEAPDTMTRRLASYAGGALVPGGIAQKAVGVAGPAIGGEVGRAVGGPTGELVGAIAGSLFGVPGARSGTAQKLSQIETASTAAYNAAENAGVVVSSPALANAARDIVQTVTKEGYHPQLHPRATAALSAVIDEANMPVGTTLERMDILKRIAGNAAKSTSPDERRIASIIQDKIDDVIMHPQPGAIIGGDQPVAAAALQEGRRLWRLKSQGETIQSRIDNAMLRASNNYGKENALRIEFQNLARNPREMRRLDPELQQAVRDVAHTGPVDWTLRQIGKLGPANIVGAAVGFGAGTYAGGDTKSGLGVLALGAGARHLSTQARMAKALMASEVARGGRLTGGSSPLLARALLAEENARRLQR